MDATATTATATRGATLRESLARTWSRVRLPLLTAPIGGVVGIVGAVLYWTLATLVSAARE